MSLVGTLNIAKPSHYHSSRHHIQCLLYHHNDYESRSCNYRNKQLYQNPKRFCYKYRTDRNKICRTKNHFHPYRWSHKICEILYHKQNIGGYRGQHTPLYYKHHTAIELYVAPGFNSTSPDKIIRAKNLQLPSPGLTQERLAGVQKDVILDV